MRQLIAYCTQLLREWRDGISPPVFFTAATINIALIAFAGIWSEIAGRLFDALLHHITSLFGGYYIAATIVMVICAFWLLFSRYGELKLGAPDEKPQFGFLAWLAMLFAAGMGMGLVFWGVAEPLYHYYDPPTAEPETAEAQAEAMRFSFFHWGLHPWAIYVIFGLCIALLHFRFGLPLAPRSLLYPLFGARIHGWLGHTTDAFCTIGTLLGVATSLGLGAMQINAGLSRVVDIDYSVTIQVWIITLITAIATISTVSGVARGIRYLSVLNCLIMGFFLIFVFLAGPTTYQITAFFTTVIDYVQYFIPTSVWLDLRAETDWQTQWTLFYWGWWFSWSPFVGIFIARISRGRTIREFVGFVLLIPTLINFIWFSVFGSTGLYLEKATGSMAGPVIDNAAVSLHVLLEHLPWTTVMQWGGLLLAVIFFITSSDSGSFVDDMVTSGGNPNPPVANRVFWGISEGAAAAVLLLAGGLQALQAASVSAGLLQSLLLLVGCVGLIKLLRSIRV
ncbi:BCCT family transporter [Nitrosomonas sp.]|uniref:BCCT family transporter n=1 Tax=Nitrosomonas sp. TaxID=42353 RepID=UPI001D2989F4|nr:BCCT family transporter [Nitrosomonas sp.]MCB1948007.1 BCCT family transporter [Nitrosomonas sp.]MCP5243870.1 BCCT family transporter [Burkholderiales bacterium]MDR4513495.1 BCCT family transporter [Nitrosomonas sp.]